MTENNDIKAPEMERKAKEPLGMIFYRFLFSNSLSSISWSLFFLFFMWKVVSDYHSVFLAGMLATIFLIVQMVTSVPIGHIIDRVNNTVLNISASAIMGLGFSLLLSGFSVYTLYAATAISSLGYTLKGDSFAAIIKKHVDPAGISRATSYQQASSSFSSLIGLGLGGVSLVLLSHYAVYLLLVLTVASAVLSRPAAERKSMVESTLNSTQEGGYRTVLSFFRKIAGFVALALIINGFFVSIDVYGAGLFKLYLDATPTMYTLFEAVVPAGAFAGSMVSNAIISKIDRPPVIAMMTFAMAPVLIVLGISRSPVIDIFAGGLLGFIIPLINVPLFARLVKATPEHMFGKVFAFLRIFVGSSTPVMATVFSFASVLYPLTSVLSLIGVIMFGVSFFTFGVIRKFYSMTSEKPAPA